MNESKPSPVKVLQIQYVPVDVHTPAGIHPAVAMQLRLLAERTGVNLPTELPKFAPAGTSAEAETQHIHHVEQDSVNNPKRVEAHAALIASGDTAKLQAEYANTIAELQALLQEMKADGYTIAAEMVTADALTHVG